jgi:hypothetical protein
MVVASVLIGVGSALVKYRDRYAAFWGRVFGPRAAVGSDRHMLGGLFLIVMGAAIVITEIGRRL